MALSRIHVSPVLAAEELAADKMLAFFSRALPRDLVGVDALVQRYGFGQLCELTAEKDRAARQMVLPGCPGDAGFGAYGWQ